ncbi:MAG: membrane protein insertase YidC [Desulfobacteraceae bacterium]|nr:membrane protein insertase YidC [Desulfobacteraceae bacterium]
MDSKALLAIVLSLLLFLAWQVYYGPSQTTQPEKKETTQTAPPASPQSPQSPQLPTTALPSAPPAPVNLSAQKTWTISDSLYKMNIVAQGARESSFSLLQHRKQVEPDSPPMQMISTRDSGFLPLAIDFVHHRDPEWSLSTRDYTSAAPAEVKINPGEPPMSIPFVLELPDKVRVTKTFIVEHDSYAMDVEIQVQNLSAQKLTDQLGISFYFRPFSEGQSSYNPSQLTFSTKRTLHNFQPADLKPESLPKPPFDWVAYEDNYFLQAIIPLVESGYQIVPQPLEGDKGIIRTVYLTEPFELGQNESRSFKLRLYSGPKVVERLDQAGHNLADAVDYGWFSFLAKPLLVVLNWLYSYIHNYGVAIIILTVIIKLIFWPLTQKSYTSMMKMKKIQPKIAQIREKYKGDREKLNQELMLVYKTYKVNPMGGCLPMVLQIPVFFALYRMLNAAVELRHQPFMLWMNDLTAPDRLPAGFSVNLPFLGELNGIPVLTILMGVTMFFQQKMTPSSGDPRQEKIMLIMPVMFTFFFINFPAGLVLYWFINNILSIAQQYWINRNAT